MVVHPLAPWVARRFVYIQPATTEQTHRPDRPQPIPPTPDQSTEHSEQESHEGHRNGTPRWDSALRQAPPAGRHARAVPASRETVGDLRSCAMAIGVRSWDGGATRRRGMDGAAAALPSNDGTTRAAATTSPHHTARLGSVREGAVACRILYGTTVLFSTGLLYRSG